MPDYEIIQDIGNGALQRELMLPILEAEFGDGYFATAIVGSTAGTYKWSLTWKSAHRDGGYQIQPVTFLGSNIGSPVSRFNYYRDFILRRVTSSPYFWLYDPDRPSSRPAYICRIVNLADVFKQQQNNRNPLLYQFKLTIQQVRGAPAQS